MGNLDNFCNGKKNQNFSLPFSFLDFK